MIINFDGATSVTNPTDKIGWGVVFQDEEHMGSMYLTTGGLTNNLAEYYGFLLSLRLIEKYKPKDKIIIETDSNLVVKQMNGQWRIKSGGYAGVARGCKRLFDRLRKHYHIHLTWVPREENEHADRLSKEALLT